MQQLCVISHICTYSDDIIWVNNIVETHCYIVITSESILMSKYLAESINQQLIAARFGHVGLRQLHIKLKMLQCEMSYIANPNSVWSMVLHAWE